MRAAFLDAFSDAMHAVLPGDVQFDDAQPRDPSRRHIWIADISGRYDQPAVAYNQWIRDDTFTVIVWCQCEQPGLTARQARTEGQRLLDTVEAAVYGQQDAIDAAVTAAGASLEWAVGDVDGPQPSPTDEGYACYAVASLEVHGRRTGVPSP